MSKDWVADIAEMHTKFEVNEHVRTLSAGLLDEYLQFRIRFLQEELDEMIDAAESGDADGVVDALIDLCVVAIGTLNAFDVDAYTAWDRVHAANMSKSAGVNPSRPNKWGLPDLIKPANFITPNHEDNTGILGKALSYDI